jgi:hypothetical protein
MNKSVARRIYRKGVFQMTREGMHRVDAECDSYLYSGPTSEAVAFLYTPPFGVPGDLSRPNAPLVVETQALNASLPFPGFGVPGKMVSGLFVPVSANNDVVYGFLVRVYPAQGLNASDPLGTAVPFTQGPANIMRKGYMNVFCQLGTPAFGNGVYIRYQNAIAGQPIGGVESGTNGNNYLLTGAQFMGPPDASGNVEISFAGANI